MAPQKQDIVSLQVRWPWERIGRLAHQQHIMMYCHFQLLPKPQHHLLSSSANAEAMICMIIVLWYGNMQVLIALFLTCSPASCGMHCLAGTWLENTSRAGMSGADPLCARGGMATACSGREPAASGREWSDRRRQLR